MFKYIYRDMMSMIRFLPWGLMMGAVISAVYLWTANRLRGRKGRERAAVLPVMVFCIYLSVMLIITFLSRESGSGKSLVDLNLFSTWGINDRNNAFVVENVLLFLPYGFFASWAFERMKRFWACTLLGTVTSLGIESLQLITARGYFQIDDILTNTLGTVIGFLLFWLVTFKKR